MWYSVPNFSHNWAIYKNEAPGTFLANIMEVPGPVDR